MFSATPHPYDPFKQKEYYNLLAVFNNTQDADIDSEYPFLREVPDTLSAKIEEVAQWIHGFGQHSFGASTTH